MSEGKKSGINMLPFKIYGAIYLVLMICYIVGLIGCDTTISTKEWLQKSFPSGGDTVAQLLKDVNAEEAEFRAKTEYSFDTLEGVQVDIKPGDRLTLPVAAELARAIKSDEKKGLSAADEKDEKSMIFPYAELKVYKKGWFWNIDWVYFFTVINILGLFIGLYFGLRAPVGKMLGDSAADTAEALATARAAKKEAIALKSKYEKLVDEVEAEKKRLLENLELEKENERLRQKEFAEQEAKAILKNVKGSINADIEIAAARLKQEIAEHAVKEARKILRSEVNEANHKAAVADFIAQLDDVEL